MNFEIFLHTGILVFIYVTLVWILSLLLKDSSIMDIFWGPGFIITAVGYYLQADGLVTRKILLLILVLIWGLRLAIHIAVRNLGKPEDARYNAWRKEAGEKWWWLSYFRVFMLQGVILWIISTPLLAAQQNMHSLNVFDYIGILLWLIGFSFESVGDWQLMKFKRNPDNKGKVFKSGLWSMSRHPNYFGEAVLWWGFYLIAVGAGGWFTVFSPVIMTYLLLRVSGVAMLDKLMLKTKPEYAEYIKSTPAFFPYIGRGK